MRIVTLTAAMALVGVLLLTLSSSANAAAGDLDPAFGSGGIV